MYFPFFLMVGSVFKKLKKQSFIKDAKRVDEFI